jgi:hypothetical protein
MDGLAWDMRFIGVLDIRAKQAIFGVMAWVDATTLHAQKAL